VREIDEYFRIGPRGAEGTAAHLLVRRPTLEIEPVDQVDARKLVVGDVVRLSDPQAHRVERMMIADRRVVLELRPVGLAVPDTVWVALPAVVVVDRLGSAGE
jgi:hypothetical protein